MSARLPSFLICAALISSAVVPGTALPAGRATLRAAYLFQDSLADATGSAPALLLVDPLMTSSFEDGEVFGQARRVLRLDGNVLSPEGTNGQQAGLQLATRGLIPPGNYSAEIVFEFLEENPGRYRKILDFSNRQLDNGLYLNPDRLLHIYPSGAVGSTPVSTPGFHHVVLTVGPGGRIAAYLNGVREARTRSPRIMKFGPDRVLSVLLDDAVVALEYADSRIALLRLYRGVLSPSQVAELAQSPLE